MIINDNFAIVEGIRNAMTHFYQSMVVEKPKKSLSLSHIGAHQGGYWIPISREKIGHIPKSR